MTQENLYTIKKENLLNLINKKMKYFGFIREHGDYKYATSIKDLIVDGNSEDSNRKEILEYLKKGVLCVAWMGFVEDATNPRFKDDDYDDNDVMGYTAVNTDGKWFWPEYIVNYLEKYPTIRIDRDFKNYVLKNKDKDIKLSKDEISKLEKEYLDSSGTRKDK